MPTLQFKGKNIIWNHHLAVPFHTLDEVAELHYQPEKANGNMIIEGDNLIALKALLPQFAGRVKCIYIDPPYNTGEEKWVYNDNTNSPLLKEWFGKVVGKDDLTRHDKWLCMMTPRLKLLRDLLADDGAIYISTDNNEYATLKLLLDDIFGEQNFVGVLIWRKKEGGGQTDQFFVTEHEYITVYRKTDQFKWLNEEVEIEDTEFKYEDEEGKYNLVKLAKWGNTARKEDRPKMHFPIYSPEGEKVLPIAPDGNPGRWRVGKKRMDSLIENNLVEFKKNNEGKSVAYEKIYFDNGNVKVIKERSILYELANTGDGSKKLTELFGQKDKFQNPKPVELISWILLYNTKENDIILDSFAGSGTTMHAVMDLNSEDGGNRSCIMVQMQENSEEEPEKNICKDLTRERIRLAIEKQKYDSGLKYCRLGIPLDAETMLAGQLPTYNQFAKYVYYLCTGENLEAENKIKEKDFYVGEYGKQAIYLVYKQDYETLTRLALNLTLAEKIKTQQPGKKRIVYAPSCFLDEEYLTDNQIEYVGIPYNLFQRNQ